MKEINSKNLRQTFLRFFEERGHAVIKSASLIPENDPSVLFTTAGMHPLIPYLMGQTHPNGKRLTDVQKCIRTGDIDEVGDNSHCTFFEMLGNWSLGDYFKEQMELRISDQSRIPRSGQKPSRRFGICRGRGLRQRRRERSRLAGMRNCERPYFLPSQKEQLVDSRRNGTLRRRYRNFLGYGQRKML